MRTASPSAHRRIHPPSRDRRGLALITVLGTLALVTVLFVSLLSSASTEIQSSRTYAANSASQDLHDTAVNLVIAQIRTATTGLGSTHSWASQPGMIRRYGITSAGLESAHKLYSSASMTEGSNFDPANESPPATWQDEPAVWTNLNQPTLQPDSTLRYPIIDPTLVGQIEGFSLESVPNIPDDTAAMPARWLYVLEDGTVGHLDATGTFVPPPGGNPATESNPIKGRIAFWADDESSKVNVNTASEGVFWDHPLGNSRTERGNAPAINQFPQAPFGYASSMAVRFEFPRYPGHPAETSLSPILGDALTLSPYPSSAELDTLYTLTPKVVLSGSKGGTIISHQAAISPPDSDRLYASADDFLFRPDRTPNELGSQPALAIERSRFFLTSHSRAPELNLFNRPRVLLWPLYRGSENRRNPTENLLAFCASPNGQPYFFQRHSPSPGSRGNFGSAYSTGLDMAIPRNTEIFGYLNRLTDTPIPGFGGKFAAKYPADTEQILFNALDWIRSSVNTFSVGLQPKHQFAAHYSRGVGEFSLVPMVLRSGATPLKGFGLNPTITEAALVLYATELEPTAPAPDEPARATKARAFLIFETFKPAPGMPHQSPGLEIEVTGLDAFRLNGQNMQFPAIGKSFIEREQYGGGWGSFTCHSPILLQLIAHGGAKYAPPTPPPFGAQDYRRYEIISVPVDLWPGGTPRDTVDFTGGSITVNLNTHPRSGFTETFQTLHFDFPSATWPVPRARSGTTLPRGFNARAYDSAVSGGASFAGAPGGDHGKMGQLIGHAKDYRRIFIEENDVVRSVETDAAGPSLGDYRLVAGRYDVPSTFFKPHPDYTSSSRDKRFAHSLRDDRFSGLGMPGWNVQNDTPVDEVQTLDQSRPSNWSTSGALVKNAKYGPYAVPITARGLNGAIKSDGRPGDWENGLGILPDGPFVRRNFEAGSSQRGDGFIKHDSSYFLYGYYYHDSTGIDFAPNRQIASAVVFGGQPTGTHSGQPWQTLLFCPNPPSRTTDALTDPTVSDHAGFGSPRDHHFLDLFWMPAVEPYAISEPFSTAGKINMNYEIMPFRHIRRRTAIHAAIKPLRIAAIPTEAAERAPDRPAYKDLDVCPWEFRYEVNTDPDTGTLRGFEERFKDGKIFRSASEICDIFLIPKKLDPSKVPPGSSYPPGTTDPTYENISTWWQGYQLTGDNAREMPYNHLYPRLTTRSNSYRVHYRVQVLQKSRSTPPDQWDETRDVVTAERRGSTLIERFLDPNETTLPDFATQPLPTQAVDDFYTYRILSTDRFQ